MSAAKIRPDRRFPFDNNGLIMQQARNASEKSKRTKTAFPAYLPPRLKSLASSVCQCMNLCFQERVEFAAKQTDACDFIIYVRLPSSRAHAPKKCEMVLMCQKVKVQRQVKYG